MIPGLRRTLLAVTILVLARGYGTRGYGSQVLPGRHDPGRLQPLASAGAVILADSGSAMPVKIRAQARSQALEMFAERCAVCHGVDGGGEGPGASNLNPKPADFRSRKWQRSVSDEKMAKVIVYGGTSVGLSASMASNPDLEDQPAVVAALVERIRKFSR